MSEQIIRSQDQIPDASMAVLLATYNALTGKSLARFESRAIAETRVANAILSAQNAAGHLGMPPGTTTSPTLTATERQFKAGGLAARLAERADATPSPPAQPVPRAPRRRALERVAAQPGGASRLQSGSVRKRIYDMIVAAGPQGITLEELDAQFGSSARGYVLKLLDKKHVTAVVTEGQSA